MREKPGLQPGGWRFDRAGLHSMLNESDRITSHLLFQRPKSEPSALNPTRAHHHRFLVICVICVIASYRSKPNPPAANRLAHHHRHCVIGVIGVIGVVIASLRHTDRTQPPAANRLAHHHRDCVICVIVRHTDRSQPPSRDPTRTPSKIAIGWNSGRAGYDFVVAELKIRVPLCPHRLGPTVKHIVAPDSPAIR